MASVNIKQHDITDCGAACLASISAHYKLFVPISKIRQFASTDKKGTNVLGLIEAAEKLKYQAKGVKGNLESLSKIPLPAIAHVIVKEVLQHYVVIYKVRKDSVWIMDPAEGKTCKRNIESFEKEWTGVLVLLLPSDNFIEKDEKVSIYKRFWFLIKPHKKVWIQALLGALFYTIIGLFTSIYIEKITDYVIPNGNKNLLNLLSVIFLILIVFQIFLGTVKNLFILKTGQHIDARLILGYYKHLLTLPQRFFDTMRVGEIISRINDAIKIRNFINDASIDFMLNIFIVFFSFSLMFIYSYKLALVILLAIPIYSFLYFIINKLNKKTERKMMENAALLESNFVESLSSINTIKSMGVEEYTNFKTEMSFIQLLKTIYKSGKNSIFSNYSSETISKLFVLILFWIGSYYVIENEITLGTLFLFYALLGYFNQPISSLIKMNSTIQNALIAADRLFEIMDLEHEKNDQFKKEQFSTEIEDIILKDISFSYGSRKEIFSNLDFIIKKGKLNVLAGESGTGKSTILNILQNIYSIKNGQILFGQIDINHIQTKSLRKNVVAVPQQIDLFKGSLIENIAFGDYEPNINKISEDINVFGFNKFIYGLPNGIESYVEEKGVNFSGGEKQKIGILRAFYKNPKIILLDETTSAMDGNSEIKVISALKEFSKTGITILFVTHRVSVMKLADNVSFLKNGKIVEQGDYKTLISRKGEFYSFLQN
ncbi:MAG: peptidase domain-containing ABC transporter [Ignavibacteriae bacterium]|nr:peptidase domain-containing ABC transporter [Ignavibacteriota bacterium]